MQVAYNTLSDSAKVWVYPSSRKFYDTEIAGLESEIANFLDTWNANDQDCKVSYKLCYNRFIVLFANQNLKSEEIDTSVAFILSLQDKYEVQLLDKMNVCFKQGAYVQYKELKEFKKLLKNRAVTAKTIVFDNLIQTKEEFEHYWEVPISESWYSRFLK